MDEEEPIVIEHGDKPAHGTTLNWLWCRDEPDGTRIDRYSANDGYSYERMIPPGGGYCYELRGTVPGREPVWKRIGPAENAIKDATRP
jgi:hypothetical protein